MWTIRGLGTVIALIAAVGCAGAPHPSPRLPALEPGLAVFGRLPSIEQVALSPNGRRIAVARTKGDQRVVAVVSLANGSVVASARAGDVKLRGIDWLDDGHVLLTTSVTTLPRGLIGARGEWAMLQVFDVAKRDVRPLLQATQNRTMNVVLGRPMVRRIDGRTMIFVTGVYATNRLLPGLFRIDVASGEETLVEKGTSMSRGWLVDENGRTVAERLYDEKEQRWILRFQRGGAPHDVSGADRYDMGDIEGFDATGERIWLRVARGDVPASTLVSLSDATLQAPDVDGWGGLIRDPLTDRVIGAVEGDDRRHTFFDAALQARWNRITQLYEGERVWLISQCEDGTKLVVLVDGPRTGYEYELVDATTGVVDPIGAVYAGMPPPAQVRRLSYSAADGLQISAYLTLPDRNPAKNLPLVVFPHGGPAASDTGGFDWWAQALAARGYAVLQPNFRGSTSSRELLAAGFGEWGRRMQTDLSDGVRFLAREGVVDPARVCIVGASYGGYAALAGVAFEPGVYRCAIAVGGLSDLARFRKSIVNDQGRYEATRRYWDHFWGTTGSRQADLGALSPAAHADAVAAPVLLIHGRDDTVVPFEQSTLMAAALERAGKAVTLVPLDGEDHWLSRSATRLQMLEYVVAFLAANNPAN